MIQNYQQQLLATALLLENSNFGTTYLLSLLTPKNTFNLDGHCESGSNKRLDEIISNTKPVQLWDLGKLRKFNTAGIYHDIYHLAISPKILLMSTDSIFLYQTDSFHTSILLTILAHHCTHLCND